MSQFAGAGGAPNTTPDGYDVVEGSVTDAAVVSDVNGTLSAKLRGLVKILSDVWDSVNHRLKVDGSAVTQPVSIASMPTTAVTISTDQILSVVNPQLLQIVARELEIQKLLLQVQTANSGQFIPQPETLPFLGF